MDGSTAGARKISPLVPAQVEQSVLDTEVEIVKVAEARVVVDVEITTVAAGVVEEEEEEAKVKVVVDAEVESAADMDQETTTEVEVVNAKIAVDTDGEITTEAAGVAEEEEAKIKLVEDAGLETTTEAVEQLPYRGPPRSSECKTEKKELTKKECVISGNKKHCQTFEIEVETIVEEEICHTITTLVCEEPLIRSGEEAEATTTVPTSADAESMDTTTITNLGRKMDTSDEESTNQMMYYGRSLHPHGCVNKVSEVCYPSQRVEKELRPKEFCWEKEAVSCQEKVEQTVDTVVCDEDKPLPQVRVTTIEPDTTTIDQEQLGRILLVATTTTAEDLTTTAEVVARIVEGTTTPADDLATTTEEVFHVEPKIHVATTTTAEDLATTVADEVEAKILVATTTTAEGLATTTEDIATTGADEQGRILVAGATTAEPETTVEPKAEAENSMDEQTTGTASAKLAADSSNDEDDETAAITAENDNDLVDNDHDDHDDDDHDDNGHDHDDHDDHDQDAQDQDDHDDHDHDDHDKDQ